MTKQDFRAELVRAKAYRFFWIIWPMISAVALGFITFGVSTVHDALARGASLESQVPSVSFLPGMPTSITGLLVAILAATLTTADESSGTTRNLRMVMSDRRIITARAIMVGVVASAATAITTLLAVVAVAMVSPSLLTVMVSSAGFWGNVIATLAVHLTWGLLALACASWWPRAAVALGGVLVVMLGVPSIEIALRAVEWDTGLFAWFPEALVRAATVTGPEAVTTVAVPTAIVCLGLWGVGLIFLAAAGVVRLRRS